MKSPTRLSSFGIGLTIFSMFFGAGNSIFPLYVGVVSKNFWYVSFFGLFLTAVLMPVLGIFAILKSRGDPLYFFERLGKPFGFLIAFFVISLLGPLGSTPRCIAISYATLISDSSISMPLFAFLACLLIFFCSLKKQYILAIIGYVLTPVLLISLVSIIITGLISDCTTSKQVENAHNLFYFGLFEGYKTMDLLAAFFFSSTILSIIAKSHSSERLLVRGGLIGGGMLSLMYGGFCFVAGVHSDSLSVFHQEQLLGKLAEILLGDKASFIVKVAISTACLTTAIALITAFTDFLQSNLLKNKLSYPVVLAKSLFLTFCISIFEFSYISRMLSFILQIIYPGLILLTLFSCLFNQKQLIFKSKNSL